MLGMILKMAIITQPLYVTLIFVKTLLFIASIKFTIGDDNVNCIAREGHALLSFKKGFNDTYDRLSSWKNENIEDCCSWEGVTCSNLTSHVIELDLYGIVGSSKRLNFLSHLSSLQYLDLSGINLENASDWMQAINKLSHLQTLKLSDCKLPTPLFPSYDPYINISISLSKLVLSRNYFTYSIFPWLSNFNTSLVHLDLSFNNFQGYIPTSQSYINFNDNHLEGASSNSFWNFCNLNSLYLRGNNFKGMFSDFLQILPNCSLDSLQYLDLALNNFFGELPVNLGQLSNLEAIDLSSNNFSGQIPLSLGQLSNLRILLLNNNSLEGTIHEGHLSKLTKLVSLDFSHNSLNFQIHSNWTPPFQLSALSLSSCKLGPKFPHWLKGQNVEILELSNTSISDSIPYWFWNFSSRFWLLDLSNNQIRGELPILSSRFDDMYEVNLRSNEFEGQIPNFLLQAKKLDVSNNKFSGLIHLCGTNFIAPLYLLDASNNQFSGELPNCWCNLSKLEVLNLANNNFSGGIPSSLNNLSELQIMHLSNNNFSGQFPRFESFNKLLALDLGGNFLTGEIPSWIGYKLKKLLRLSLRSNQFYGELPSSLCHLNNISFLDVSSNSITGVIPNCLHNLSSLVMLNSNIMREIYIGGMINISNGDTVPVDEVDDEMIVMWKGRESVMKEILPFLRSIDFSGNHLSGKIPDEIVELVNLVSLNLSRNNLTGEIPENIGGLKSLDFLDLSRNELVGNIPQSLSQIDRLSVLDLSFNKLSGKIPVGTQLQSFNASTYMGNDGLCGSPLPSCFITENFTNSINKDEEVVPDGNEIVMQGFYIGLVVGFIIVFWGVCGTLIFHIRWRCAYFRMSNEVND